MNTQPTISIITVTYNCANDIETTIQSVLQQTYPQIEYLIIDGGSSDGTQEVISRYSQDIAYFISEPDKGIYDAMNKGIRQASGEWVFFLNAGDIFTTPQILERIFSQEWEAYSAIYGDIYEIRRGKPFHWKADCPFWLSEKKFHGMGFSHQGVFLRTSLAKSLPFDLNFRCCADYHQMTRVHQGGGKFAYCNEVIAMVIGCEGFSDQNVYIQKREEAILSQSLGSLSYYKTIADLRIRRFIKRLLHY